MMTRESTPIVIGLTGKAGSGKDESAKTLESLCKSINFPVVTIHFAKALKKIAKEVFGWDGKKDERGRKLLQLIGTEVARAYNPNFWIARWKENLDSEKYIWTFKKENYFLVLVPDVRFDNEADLVHSFSGEIVEIIGRQDNLGANANHASESGLSRVNIDYTIDNSGTIEDLRRKLISFWYCLKELGVQLPDIKE